MKDQNILFRKLPLTIFLIFCTPLILFLVYHFILLERCTNMAFDRLDKTTEIKIEFNDGYTMPKNVTNQEQIDEVIHFIKNRKYGWYAPWFGVPVGKTRAEFFAEKKFVGDFNAGQSFFEAQGCGYFYIRDAWHKEISEFINILKK